MSNCEVEETGVTWIKLDEDDSFLLYKREDKNNPCRLKIGENEYLLDQFSVMGIIESFFETLNEKQRKNLLSIMGLKEE